jgi:hypothetical protein
MIPKIFAECIGGGVANFHKQHARARKHYYENGQDLMGTMPTHLASGRQQAALLADYIPASLQVDLHPVCGGTTTTTTTTIPVSRDGLTPRSCSCHMALGAACPQVKGPLLLQAPTTSNPTPALFPAWTARRCKTHAQCRLAFRVTRPTPLTQQVRGGMLCCDHLSWLCMTVQAQHHPQPLATPPCSRARLMHKPPQNSPGAELLSATTSRISNLAGMENQAHLTLSVLAGTLSAATMQHTACKH